MMNKKSVVLGITGGIAAYKAIDLASVMTKHGLDVHVVLTREALKFVTPLTLEVITKNQVWTDDNCLEKSSIPHIKLADLADLVVVAPATANTMAKGANGLADNLLSSILLATEKPVLYVPAMNTKMYEHEATQRNFRDLKEQGAIIMDPAVGMLACGSQGKGRYPSNKLVLVEIEKILYGDRALQGFKVLVTAGGTREAIDPVRYVGNRSSGKMGAALCEEALSRGAEVTLILGSHELLYLPEVTIIQVESAEEMYQAVMEQIDMQDIIIKAAAVADFTPMKPMSNKMKKNTINVVSDNESSMEVSGGARPDTPKTIELVMVATKDILKEIAQRKKKQIVVGFAAETEKLEENAKQKLINKKLDMIVANDVTNKDSGFGSDHNKVTLFLKNGKTKDLEWMPKSELAKHIIDEIIAMTKFGKMAR